MLIGRRSFVAGVGTAALVPRAAWAAGGPLRIPVTLTDRRVLVDCTVKGQGPFPFVFDTGGTIGLLDLQFVRRMKLAQTGFSQLGMRDRPGRYPLFLVPEIVFGGQVRQPNAVFAGIEAFPFGDGAVGSLAAGVLTASDAELDFEAREWRVHRDAAPDRTSWTRYDKAIVHRGNMNGSAFLFADVALGGRTFRMGLDTGMPGAMHLYRKTAEAAGLWDAPRWSPAAPGGKNRMVRIASLGLGGTTVEGVVATLIEQPEWQYFDAGVVGLPVLRRFNMATAEREGALYLKRNGLAAQPERYNRAGLWIDRDGKGVKVGVVGRGSPAEAAGIKPGDRLTGSDFQTLIDRMSASAGSLPLTVERGGARREVTLELRDYL